MLDPYSAPLTLILLLVNVLIGFYTMTQDPSIIDRWAFKPRRILIHKEYYRLLSAGFVHASFAHLLFNMITLFFFGPILEQLLGTLAYGVVYFGAELAANLIPLWRFRDDPNYAAVGASGAISGVLFGFCLFAPMELIYIFFAIPIPAALYAVLFVVLSIYWSRNPERSGMMGKVAHEAHLGGALGGLLLTILMEPRVIPHFLSQIGLG